MPNQMSDRSEEDRSGYSLHVRHFWIQPPSFDKTASPGPRRTYRDLARITSLRYALLSGRPHRHGAECISSPAPAGSRELAAGSMPPRTTHHSPKCEQVRTIIFIRLRGVERCKRERVAWRVVISADDKLKVRAAIHRCRPLSSAHDHKPYCMLLAACCMLRAAYRCR